MTSRTPASIVVARAAGFVGPALATIPLLVIGRPALSDAASFASFATFAGTSVVAVVALSRPSARRWADRP